MYSSSGLSTPIQELTIDTIYGRHLTELTTRLSKFDNSFRYDMAKTLSGMAKVYELQNTIHVGGPIMSGRSTLASSLVTGIGEVLYICQTRCDWQNFQMAHRTLSDNDSNFPDHHIGNIRYPSEDRVSINNINERSINPFKIIIIDDASNFKSIHAKPNGLNLVYRTFILNGWVDPSTWIIHIH